MLGRQVPRSLVSPLPYCGRPQELEEPKALGSRGNNGLLDGFLLPFPQLRQMLLGNRGSEQHRAKGGVSGVSSQVFRRALRRPLKRPGSALEALATGGCGPPFPSDFKPPPLPRHPPGEEEARPAVASEAGQTGAWPGPDPRSPALRLRPRIAASLSGLDPFPLLPGGSRSRPRPSLPGSPLLSFSSPPPPALCF